MSSYLSELGRQQVDGEPGPIAAGAAAGKAAGVDQPPEPRQQADAHLTIAACVEQSKLRSQLCATLRMMSTLA